MHHGYITKLSAAESQLRSAIRMYFMGEDELAIHTVASAAYRLIVDLKKHRGMDEISDYHTLGIFYLTQDYVNDLLPIHIKENAELMKFIEDAVNRFSITNDTKYENFKFTFEPEAAKEWWNNRNKVTNFLKHADRDNNTSISLDEVDNLQLLLLARSSYIQLANDEPGLEGIVLFSYYNLNNNSTEHLQGIYQEIAEKFNNIDIKERLSFCSHMLQDMRKKDLFKLP